MMSPEPDDPIWERIHECAAMMIAGLTDDEIEHGRHERLDSTAILEAYRRGDNIIRSRAENGQLTPFEQFELLPPGAWDVRIFDQATWWVDEACRRYRIDDRHPTTQVRALLMMARLWDEASAHHEAYTRAFPARTVPSDPRAWLEDTALVTALLRRFQEEESVPMSGESSRATSLCAMQD